MYKSKLFSFVQMLINIKRQGILLNLLNTEINSIIFILDSSTKCLLQHILFK